MGTYVMGNFDLKERLKLSTMLFGLAAAVSFTSPASAQDEALDEEAEDRDRIVVTGSRIGRVEFDTVRPAVNVDAEVFEKRAFTNVAQALNEVPAFGVGVDPTGDQSGFSPGQNFVDLFDLGTQRTLTLVNGRRFVSSNPPTIFGNPAGFQVDLNAVPVALIERIEVVPLSGAAVYGSDAIAGTVNVILKDDYEGFEVSGQYGLTEEGDAEQYQVQAVFGANFASGRGNVTFSVEYNKTEGLVEFERPDIYGGNQPDFLLFGQQDLNGDGEPDDVNRDGVPDSYQRVVFGGQRVQLVTNGGSVSPTTTLIPSIGAGALADGNFYQFNRAGDLVTCEPGTTPAGSVFFAYGGTCGEDFFNEVDQIVSPVDRLIVSGSGHYEIFENVRFFGEFIFANTNSEELVEQGGFQTFAFGGTSGALTFPTSNPFLTDQARGILEGNGLTSFGLNRFNNDLVGRGVNKAEGFTWRTVAGFDGTFEAFGREYQWDISGTFGQSDVESETLGIVDGRFINAIDAVEVTQEVLDSAGVTLEDIQGIGGTGPVGLGDIVCRSTIDSAAGTLTGANTPVSGFGVTDGDNPYVTGCVPLNLFGEGNASPDAINWVNGGPQISLSDLRQIVFTANVSGPILDLPAGELAMAAGFESRREEGDFRAGLGFAVPLTRSSAINPTSGRLTTKEIYGEILVPILSKEMMEDFGIPFIESLEMTASVRRVDNKVTAPDGSDTSEADLAYEYGGRFVPYEGVTFRGSFARSIRTPSLVELFTPTVQNFVFIDDPCDFRFVNLGAVPDRRRANCIADGISDPDNFVSNAVNATIIGENSGNPDLLAEKANSWTVGVVLQPEFIPGLTITADYFNITIQDRIENFEADDLTQICYDSSDFPRDGACGTFERDPVTRQLTFARETFLNASSSEFDAINMQMIYNFDLSDALSGLPSQFISEWADNTDLGEITFNFNVLHNRSGITVVSETAPEEEEYGDFLDPSFEGNFDTTWVIGPFRWFYRVQYQDSPLFDETGQQFFLDLDDNIIEDTRARLIHNMSFSYEFYEGQAFVQLSVDNLLNRKPNLFETANFHFGAVEELGRRYTLRVRTRF